MELRDRTVLVTGGSGFIGSHLVRRLVREGARVYALVRTQGAAWRLDDVAAKVAIVRADLTDSSSIRRGLETAMPSVVFHLAGVTDLRWLSEGLGEVETSIEINLKGTLNLLLGAAQCHAPVERFIRAGGLEEYGAGPQRHVETEREQPVSPYSASQTAATHYCQMLAPHLPFVVLTLRLALVYGPAQSSRFFIPSLIAHCLEGRDFEMTHGNQERDLLHVDDVVEAFVRCATAEQLSSGIINVASSYAPPIREVAAAILRLSGATIRLKRGEPQARFFDVPRLCASNRKAAELLGWSPTTALDQGLSSTIDWYRQHVSRVADRGSAS